MCRMTGLTAIMLLNIFCLMPTDTSHSILLIELIAATAYIEEQYWVRLPIRPLKKRNRKIRDYLPAVFESKFGFNQDHAVRLLHCISLGDYIKCLMLYRLKYARKLTDIEEEFGLDYIKICRIFSTTIAIFVDKNYCLPFNNINCFVPRLESYSLAIRSKIISQQHEHLVGPSIKQHYFEMVSV
jgi:hypothetical protein